jgi:hypothetical protein
MGDTLVDYHQLHAGLRTARITAIQNVYEREAKKASIGITARDRSYPDDKNIGTDSNDFRPLHYPTIYHSASLGTLLQRLSPHSLPFWWP